MTKTGQFPALEAVNLRMDYQIKNTAESLTWRLEMSIGQLDSQLRKSICMTNVKSDQTPFQINSKLYGLIKGQVLYTFTCQEKTVPLKEDTSCYDKIPLQMNSDQPYFMDPQTRLLTKHASTVPCDPHYPMKINALEGWITVNPRIQPSTPPAVMYLPEATLAHHDAAKGGIYTENEERAWEELIAFPAYSKALLKSVSIGACSTGAGSCSKPTAIGATAYNMDSLIPSIDSLNPLAKVMSFLHDYGDLLALIVIGIWICQALVYGTTIVLTYLSGGPAAAAAMIYTMCCRSKKDYDKIKRRNMNTRIAEEVRLPMIPTSPTDQADPPLFSRQ